MKQILDSGLSGTLFKAEKSQPSVVELSWRVSGRPFYPKIYLNSTCLSLIENKYFFQHFFTVIIDWDTLYR